MPFHRNFTAIAASALLAAACAGPGLPLSGLAVAGGGVQACLGRSGFGEAPEEADPRGTTAAGFIEARFDRFLDCYVGPELAPDETTAAPVKALRGHAVTTAIARYAAFNVTGTLGPHVNLRFQPYPQMQRDAAGIVVSLARAERSFGAASGLFESLAPPPAAIDFLPRVKGQVDFLERVDRMMTVLDAVGDAATPTGRRSELILSRLVASIALPTPGNIRLSLDGLATGLGKLAILDGFVEAYRGDIRDYLTCAQARETGRPQPTGTCQASLAEDWTRWDAALDEACDRLAKVGSIANICIRRAG